MTDIVHSQNMFPFEELNLRKLTEFEEGKTAPMVYWPPTRKEIKTFVYIAREVHTGQGHPTILDAGCGNAFLSYLIAKEGGVKVIGIDTNEELIYKTPYKHPLLELAVGKVEEAAYNYRGLNFDVVLCSWMPKYYDFTTHIHNINPKAIIYAKKRTKGTGTADSFRPGEKYEPPFMFWEGICFHEIDHYFKHWLTEAMPYEDPNGPYGNIIEIQLRNDVSSPRFPPAMKDPGRYSWEAEMEQMVKSMYKGFKPEHNGPFVTIR